MDLSDPYLKTARAKEHLDALQKELESFYNSKPYEIQGKVNNKEGLCQIRIQVKDPPNRLSIIAGDILSCLRASPDHLVWLLATNNAASYAGRTQFPIMEVNESSSFKGPDCK